MEEQLTARDLLNLVDATLAANTPPRGSAPYRAIIQATATEDELSQVTDTLIALWSDYGWRGVLDVMVECVHQIDHSPHLPPSLRDMFGAVAIERLLLIDPTEEEALELATQHANDVVAEDGAAPHEAFAESLRLSGFAFDVARQWRPHVNAALRAMAQHQDQRAVFAALCRAPGRSEYQTAVQAAMLLASATASVRHLPNLSPEELRRIAKSGALQSPWKRRMRTAGS